MKIFAGKNKNKKTENFWNKLYNAMERKKKKDVLGLRKLVANTKELIENNKKVTARRRL